MTSKATGLRVMKGLQLSKGDGIRATTQNRYTVPSSQSEKNKYVIDMDNKTCTCPDFVFRKVFCKHIIGVILYRTSKT